MKKAYIVMTKDTFGIGPTARKAAKNCEEAGAARGDWSALYLIIGDEQPNVDDRGCIIRDRGSEKIMIGCGYKLRTLTDSAEGD